MGFVSADRPGSLGVCLPLCLCPSEVGCQQMELWSGSPLDLLLSLLALGYQAASSSPFGGLANAIITQ